MARVLHIDLETYSSVDIGKAGLYRYAQSPDFEILLFAYSFGDEDEVLYYGAKWGRQEHVAERADDH